MQIRKEVATFRDLDVEINSHCKKVDRHFSLCDFCLVCMFFLTKSQRTVWRLSVSNSGKWELVKAVVAREWTIVKIQALFRHCAVLTSDDRIVYYRYDGSTRVVGTKKNFVDIATGPSGYLVALTADNRLYATGNNTYGQCGQGSTSDRVRGLSEVKNLPNLRIKQISAGRFHVLIKCSKI